MDIVEKNKNIDYCFLKDNGYGFDGAMEGIDIAYDVKRRENANKNRGAKHRNSHIDL